MDEQIFCNGRKGKGDRAEAVRRNEGTEGKKDLSDVKQGKEKTGSDQSSGCEPPAKRAGSTGRNEEAESDTTAGSNEKAEGDTEENKRTG